MSKSLFLVPFRHPKSKVDTSKQHAAWEKERKYRGYSPKNTVDSYRKMRANTMQRDAARLKPFVPVDNGKGMDLMEHNAALLWFDVLGNKR